MKRRQRLLSFIIGLLLAFPPIGLQAMDKQADTIDELLEMFDESKCMECHEEIHNEWARSKV
jgi:hypothetical protein